MKTLYEINKNKVPTVRLDTTLDKYDNVVLFPKKLAKANEQIAKSGFPKANTQMQRDQCRVRSKTADK